jgi:hypothetical protein
MSKDSVQFNKTSDEILRDRKSRSIIDVIKQPRQILGGVPPVKIPPLNAEIIDRGGSMSQQAETLQNPASPLSPSYDPQLALDNKRSLGVFATINPEDQNDASFIKGVGSMYTANQPLLKNKPKTVMEDGGYKPAISEQTRVSLEALAAFQNTASKIQESKMHNSTSEDKKREVEASNLGKVITKNENDMYDEFKELLDDPKQWNELNNPKRRKKIEDRLQSMDITEIIVYGEIRQEVIVIPDKLIYTYRSVSGEEDLAVKRMMFGATGGDRYLMDKYSIMQLSLALVSINGDELPTHLDDRKKFDETKFFNKFDKVVKFPIQFIADLGVQYLWFDERIRKLFNDGSTESLKNT